MSGHTMPGNVNPKRDRNSTIKKVFLEFSQCESNIFDCSDKSLQKGDLDSISETDFMLKQEYRQDYINSIIKIRSRVNLKLKVAKQILKRLENS